MVITDDSKRYPGSAFGIDEFLISYVQDKVFLWVGEIEKLSDIAVTQPQAAYAVFIHVFQHHWSYITHTVLMSHDLYCPLDENLGLRFLPTLTGQSAFGPTEKGTSFTTSSPWGLGVIDPSIYFSSSFSSCRSPFS